jgi:hypothetical protein
MQGEADVFVLPVPGLVTPEQVTSHYADVSPAAGMSRAPVARRGRSGLKPAIGPIFIPGGVTACAASPVQAATLPPASVRIQEAQLQPTRMATRSVLRSPPSSTAAAIPATQCLMAASMS